MGHCINVFFSNSIIRKQARSLKKRSNVLTGQTFYNLEGRFNYFTFHIVVHLKIIFTKLKTLFFSFSYIQIVELLLCQNIVLYHILMELHTCQWQLSAVIKDIHFHILQTEHAKQTASGTMIVRIV